MKSAAAIVDRYDKPDNVPDDDVLDVRGAMALLKVGRDSIYAGVANLSIPHRRIGKHIRFSRAALVRWLDSCGPHGALKGQ